MHWTRRAFDVFRNILLTKTHTWSHEQEIRFVGKRQDVSFAFDGHIVGVTFGPNVPQDTVDRLADRIRDRCPVSVSNLSAATA